MQKLTNKNRLEKETMCSVIHEIKGLSQNHEIIHDEIGGRLETVLGKLKVELLFGVELPSFCSAYDGYVDISGNEAHSMEKILFVDGERRKISWPDGDRLPKNEWLYVIGFSTGAYIFGEHYPKALFQDFWEELKDGVKYKYIDTANHCLYVEPEHAFDASQHLHSTLDKYRDRVDEYKRQREIEELERKLAKMKEEQEHE